MPSMANIVVKKDNGTTDITYTGVSPSSGDKTAAVWKQQAAGAAIGHQPELRVIGRVAQGGQAREMHCTFMYPQLKTDTTTGVTSIQRKGMGSATFTVPVEMANADVNEFVSQFANLLASALIKDCAKTGYSAS